MYAGGLSRIEPQSVAPAEVRLLFDGFGVKAISKMISPQTGKVKEAGSHYYYFVGLTHSHKANMAVMELDGKGMKWSGKLRVNHARKQGSKVIREYWLMIVRSVPIMAILRNSVHHLNPS